MGLENERRHQGTSWRWPLATAAAVLALASCSPPMPDNRPPASGDPVVATEVAGHWFKLVGHSDLTIDVRPLVAESVVNLLVDDLRDEIPELSDDRPLYIHVSDVLDQGAVADVSAGVFVGIELLRSQQMTPVEQPDGSLLFEGANLASFMQRSMLKADGVADPLATDAGYGPDESDLKGLSVTDTAVKLWLYRVAGSEDMHFRISAGAAVEVPVVGRVDVQVSVDGMAALSVGPEADGLVPGTVAEFD